MPLRLTGVDALAGDFSPDPSLSDEPLPDVVATMWKASTSGGSTGLPRLIWENRSSAIDPTDPFALLRIQVDDVVLHPAAAYHNASFSQTNWALCWGCHVLLMERFDAAEWLAAGRAAPGPVGLPRAHHDEPHPRPSRRGPQRS